METPDTDLTPLLQELATANRILAHKQILDAYGHASVRSGHVSAIAMANGAATHRLRQ